MEIALEWGAPAPALRPYVHRYVGFVERTPAPLRRRELPSGDVHLIISFGPHWDLALHGGRHYSFVAGLDDRHAFSEHQGFAHGIEIQFTPLGAGAFMGLPMRELTYYDQAHLNRDFRAFAGATPTDCLAGRLPGQAGFHEETSVQDGLPAAA